MDKSWEIGFFYSLRKLGTSKIFEFTFGRIIGAFEDYVSMFITMIHYQVKHG